MKTKYRRAKLRLIKKRVFKWDYSNRHGSSSVEFIENGGNSITFRIHDNGYQRCLRLRELGFVKGFWYARLLEKNKDGYLTWDRKLKEVKP